MLHNHTIDLVSLNIILPTHKLILGLPVEKKPHDLWLRLIGRPPMQHFGFTWMDASNLALIAIFQVTTNPKLPDNELDPMTMILIDHYNAQMGNLTEEEVMHA